MFLFAHVVFIDNIQRVFVGFGDCELIMRIITISGHKVDLSW